MPEVDQLIKSKYRLVRHIGDGGMGSVFEARHETLGARVALKFLHPELARRQGLVKRFLQEARVSAQIHSPHVVRVTDVDQTDEGLAYIVLEYLEGKTLQALYEDLYRKGERLSYPEALSFATQMIEGVEAAHAAGVVHRDLKPDNVMITKDSKGAPLVKILDFGIAKLKAMDDGAPGLTRPGVTMGTPEYMAPEQAYSADAVDARADVFSLGVILFEMLAGRRPVGGDDPQLIAGAYLAGQIAQLTDLVPGIAPDLAAAIHWAMAPLVKDRCPTAHELREAVEPFAEATRPVQPSRVRPSPTNSPTNAPSPVAATPAMPGGVAKTWPPDAEPPPRVAGTMIDEAGAVGPRGSGTMVDMGTTRPMDPYMASQTPAVPTAPIGAGRRRRGTSTGTVVLIIVGVLALVGGGIGVAVMASQSSNDDRPTRHALPPLPAPTPTPAQPQPGPAPKPQPAQPQPPQPVAPGPTPPPATPGPGPKPQPQPATPSPLPAFSTLPMIPSVFNFPNPFQPPPAQPAQPAQPAPSGSPKPPAPTQPQLPSIFP